MDSNSPLTCTVCYNAFTTSARKPFDLGCGHSFCLTCINSSPASFLSCPECRQPAGTPHANIALLRFLETHHNREQQQAGTRTGSSCSYGLNEAASRVFQSRTRRGNNGRDGSARRPPRSGWQALCSWSAFLVRYLPQAVNTWWGSALLVCLYLISPVDLVPDFIPIVGLLDDAVVMFFALYNVYNAVFGFLG